MVERAAGAEAAAQVKVKEHGQKVICRACAQERDAAKVDAAAVHVVLEAAGRGDDDVDRLAHLARGGMSR